jgi:hypothetical protein
MQFPLPFARPRPGGGGGVPDEGLGADFGGFPGLPPFLRRDAGPAFDSGFEGDVDAGGPGPRRPGFLSSLLDALGVGPGGPRSGSSGRGGLGTALTPETLMEDTPDTSTEILLPIEGDVLPDPEW